MCILNPYFLWKSSVFLPTDIVRSHFMTIKMLWHVLDYVSFSSDNNRMWTRLNVSFLSWSFISLRWLCHHRRQSYIFGTLLLEHCCRVITCMLRGNNYFSSLLSLHHCWFPQNLTFNYLCFDILLLSEHVRIIALFIEGLSVGLVLLLMMNLFLILRSSYGGFIQGKCRFYFQSYTVSGMSHQLT